MTVRSFFGGLLCLIGGLLALLSGGCSLFFVFGGMDLESLPLVLLVGGIPFIIGLLLYKWGSSLLKAESKVDQDNGTL